MQSPPMHKYGQHERPYGAHRRNWDRRGGGRGGRGQGGPHVSNEHVRRVAKVQRGKPWLDTRGTKGPFKDKDLKAKKKTATSDDTKGESNEEAEAAETMR